MISVSHCFRLPKSEYKATQYIHPKKIKILKIIENKGHIPLPNWLEPMGR